MLTRDDHGTLARTAQPGFQPRPETTGASGAAQPESRESANATSANQLPALSIPKGGGAIRGMGEKFAANPVTGTGSMSVPIATSPGRSGFGPQLSLSYDSGAGNEPFGFGWNLSLPSINRKTDKGLPQYRDAEESDVFILSSAEDLVPVFKQDDTGWVRDALGNFIFDEMTREGYRVRRYRPRLEGLFARIERWTRIADGDVHWRSLTKENLTTLYGKTNNSRITDPADNTRVFSWLICESHDDKGNAVFYKYKEENSDGVDLAQVHEKNRAPASRSANRYLKRIKYGNRTPHQPGEDLSLRDDWLFEAVFDYGEHYAENDQGQPTFVSIEDNQHQWESRQDSFSTYRAGFEVRTYRLCRRVLMFHHFPDELGTNDYLVRATEFTYNQTPIASFITKATQASYARRSDNTYLKKSLPPLEFEYSQAIINEEIKEVDSASLENLPYGLDGARYQWVDLDGEGLSGILTEQGEGWFYKRNLSPIHLRHENGGEMATASFGPVELVAEKPSLAALNGGGQQFLDLAGDGQLDLVDLQGPTPGFYERTHDERWESFAPFDSLPVLEWGNPNLKFVDLTGDGHADIFISEDEAFCWHPSLAEAGFGPAEKVRQALDEEEGPRLVFAEGTQSIYLADLSGDGLTDLVRIRNGEVCYWPNLGYGRFGMKVTMDNAPWFDAPDLFDQRRIRLADLDGSGVTDIIYLGSDGVHLYFNQSGNSWSDAQTLARFPRIDNLSAVMVADLLGNGTACLVWSSPLPGDAQRPMRYVDLMGGQKPHLLLRTSNNLGAETKVHYAPSTKFYLQDKLEGKPWITKIPFPVHVVERVSTHDRISGNRFVTRYAYHHGYFDGLEREFRGFGMVEQFDTEAFAVLDAEGSLSDATNIAATSHVPPVHTKTWFHTGAYLGRDRISNFFAGLLDEEDTGEYYREPGLTDAQFEAMLLPDTVLPENILLANGSRPSYSPIDEELREACRALKGAILRQEIYAEDESSKSAHPYSVSERNYTLEILQPQSGNRHAVFFAHPRETIAYHYERNHQDPRVGQQFVLQVDPFGNVLKAAAVGYGRREIIRVIDAAGHVQEISNPGLNQLDPIERTKQTQPLLTCTENTYTNDIHLADAYRAPLPCESRTFELTGLALGSNTRFAFDNMLDAVNDAAVIAYPETPNGDLQKRVIEHVRTLFRRDDLTALLPLSELEPLALPGESYKLAFTAGLLAVYQLPREGQPPENLLPDAPAVLRDVGKYVDLDNNGSWWIPSGRVLFSPNDDAPSDELAFARAHFFLPHRVRDPFGETAVVHYDNHKLLATQAIDSLNNTTIAENDYRVLQPWRVTDPNGNRAHAAFDTFGMVVATAAMGKEGENKGDTIERDFPTDLADTELFAFVADPRGHAASLLRNATARVIYDLHRFQRSGQPPFAATLARETHFREGGLKIQISFTYSDGFGREAQTKVQAEPGDAPEREPDIVLPGGDRKPGALVLRDGETQPAHTDHRWVGNGRTIYNNKGKPVKKYEPFFSATHLFEEEPEMTLIGVTPILFYDPVERVVATLHPNYTYEKVVFDPWQQTTWDVNDTVTQTDPRADLDAGEFFGLLEEEEFLPTWYEQRIDSALGAHEQEAARKAARHANTPTTAHLDTLGRSFLTIARNGLTSADEYRTRVELDIEGNQRSVTDARNLQVMAYDYDMLGTRIHQNSMDAGEKWTLNDVAGKPIRAWDTPPNPSHPGHAFRMEYDELRRPVRSFVKGAIVNVPNLKILFERTVYGEAQGAALNIRGKVYQMYDAAGVVTNNAYDFKGNSLSSSRQLLSNYTDQVNWNDAPRLENEIFTSSTTYDALNRPVTLTTPDNSVIHPIFNEANLLNAVTVNLRGANEQTEFVTNIDYNAKGQRELIEYGSGMQTDNEYDPLTFRLTNLKTTR